MKAKPPALRVIAGTSRPDRERASLAGELVPLTAAPPAPDWLVSPTAIAEWDRLAARLTACRLLDELMLMPLAHLCALHATLVQLHREGIEPRAALVAQYVRLAGDFGLTPLGASRLPPPPKAATNNPFDKFRR
jgi:phage terminase small subunit